MTCTAPSRSNKSPMSQEAASRASPLHKAVTARDIEEPWAYARPIIASTETATSSTNRRSGMTTTCGHCTSHATHPTLPPTTCCMRPSPCSVSTGASRSPSPDAPPDAGALGRARFAPVNAAPVYLRFEDAPARLAARFAALLRARRVRRSSATRGRSAHGSRGPGGLVKRDPVQLEMRARSTLTRSRARRRSRRMLNLRHPRRLTLRGHAQGRKGGRAREAQSTMQPTPPHVAHARAEHDTTSTEATINAKKRALTRVRNKKGRPDAVGRLRRRHRRFRRPARVAHRCARPDRAAVRETLKYRVASKKTKLCCDTLVEYEPAGHAEHVATPALLHVPGHTAHVDAPAPAYVPAQHCVSPPLTHACPAVHVAEIPSGSVVIWFSEMTSVSSAVRPAKFACSEVSWFVASDSDTKPIMSPADSGTAPVNELSSSASSVNCAIGPSSGSTPPIELKANDICDIVVRFENDAGSVPVKPFVERSSRRTLRRPSQVRPAHTFGKQGSSLSQFELTDQLAPFVAAYRSFSACVVPVGRNS